MDWLTVSPELLVIHYEDFLTDATEQLRIVHNFLKFPVDEKRIRCIHDNPYNKWKRLKKETGFKNDPFAPDDLHRIFDLAILQVQDVLRARGYRLIPINKYSHTKIAL
jgi:hypothetical protein